MPNTSTRLKQLMNERNLKQVDILKLIENNNNDLGFTISKTALSQYVSGKFKPNQGKLYLLAKALDVNEAWLMGFDVDMARIPEKDRVVNNKITNSKYQLTNATHIFSDQNTNSDENISEEPLTTDIKEALKNTLTTLQQKENLLYEGKPLTNDTRQILKSSIKATLKKADSLQTQNSNEIITIAAHHDGDGEFSDKELELIEKFKQFVINENKK